MGNKMKEEIIEKCPNCNIEKTEENYGYDNMWITLTTHNREINPTLRFYYCKNCGHMYDIDYEI